MRAKIGAGGGDNWFVSVGLLGLVHPDEILAAVSESDGDDVTGLTRWRTVCLTDASIVTLVATTTRDQEPAGQLPALPEMAGSVRSLTDVAAIKLSGLRKMREMFHDGRGYDFFYQVVLAGGATIDLPLRAQEATSREIADCERFIAALRQAWPR